MTKTEALKKLMLVPKLNGYALAYINTYFNLGLLYEGEMLIEAERVQILYILNNISNLRSQEVKEIREILRDKRG